MTSTSAPARAPARLEPKHFFDLLTSHGVDFYAGVPDTVLKDFLAYVSDHVPLNRHVLTVDEGASAALAMGYHVATRRIPVVYTQDGGIGNLVHSLISLCDARVYAIPMLLVVGWCGQPGTNADLPHAVEGAVLTSLLTDLSIPFAMLPTDAIGARDAVAMAFEQIKRSSAPYALIVRHETFAPHPLSAMEPNRFSLTREQALRLVLTQVGASDALVSTTGFTRRELYALREERGEDHRRDLLVVGGMGYSSTVALGVALAQPTRTTWCIDGDGAILMHMGTLATVGSLRPARFKHVLINNGVHDSVGGQATCSFTVNFPKMAEACGYVRAWKVSAEEDVRKAIAELRALDGPGFVEVLINKGARADLPRFAMTPVENKEAFMRFLEEEVARE